MASGVLCFVPAAVAAVAQAVGNPCLADSSSAVWASRNWRVPVCLGFDFCVASICFLAQLRST